VKKKISELTPNELDAAVAATECVELDIAFGVIWRKLIPGVAREPYEPSRDWRIGGPIIERDQIFLDPPHDVHQANIGKDGTISGVWKSFETWHATVSARTRTYPNPNFSPEERANWPGCVGRGEGPTALIAAMRAKVASHYGHEVELP
jgi:hypothetical protein